MPPTKNVDLNIEIEVLTATSVAEIVNSILKYLLYQRNQIPLVYDTFKYYVNSWEGQLQSETTTLVNAFHVVRQRELAIQTKKAINELCELISKSFEGNDIKTLRFLFGATTFTPKESYTIHIPLEAISRNHSHDHHRLSSARLNQILMALLTSEDLYTQFSNNLCPTNVYLELELHENVANHFTNVDNNAQTFPKYIGQLPRSCKDIHIHLLHRLPLNFDLKSLQCCKDLKIFHDSKRLSINSETPDEVAGPTKQELPLTMCTTTTCWREADIIVRGIKGQLAGRNSIWYC